MSIVSAPSRGNRIGRKLVTAAGAVLVGFLTTYYLLRDDLFANQVKTTSPVPKQSSIQRQYALALIENDVTHWEAVWKNHPPTDATSRDYALKAQLQIARLYIASENYFAAEKILQEVRKSDYTEPAIPVIATIEMGYVSNRISGELFRTKFYDEAVSKMSVLDPAKRDLVKDSLPIRVKEEWDRETRDRTREETEAKEKEVE